MWRIFRFCGELNRSLLTAFSISFCVFVCFSGGRDGKPALSVLYYGGVDAKLKIFLASLPPPGADRDGKRSAKTQATIDRAGVAVQAVISFCETVTKCRRVQLLSHFGETADAATICGAHGCDVCADKGDVKKRMMPVYRRKAPGAGARFLSSAPSGFSSAASMAAAGTPAGSGFMSAKAFAGAQTARPRPMGAEAKFFQRSSEVEAQGGRAAGPAPGFRPVNSGFRPANTGFRPANRLALSERQNQHGPAAERCESPQNKTNPKRSNVSAKISPPQDDVESISSGSSSDCRIVGEEKAPKRPRRS